ncbi:MAG: hypothetical protein JXR59_05520 [Desulfuromonadaceae bacterium]|nr:hypothetical protein [Desulfuromonadaceae bacterium]
MLLLCLGVLAGCRDATPVADESTATPATPESTQPVSIPQRNVELEYQPLPTDHGVTDLLTAPPQRRSQKPEAPIATKPSLHGKLLLREDTLDARELVNGAQVELRVPLR